MAGGTELWRLSTSIHLVICKKNAHFRRERSGYYIQHATFCHWHVCLHERIQVMSSVSQLRRTGFPRTSRVCAAARHGAAIDFTRGRGFESLSTFCLLGLLSFHLATEMPKMDTHTDRQTDREKTDRSKWYPFLSFTTLLHSPVRDDLWKALRRGNRALTSPHTHTHTHSSWI